jgi:hypothetical protein
MLDEHEHNFDWSQIIAFEALFNAVYKVASFAFKVVGEVSVVRHLHPDRVSIETHTQGLLSISESSDEVIDNLSISRVVDKGPLLVSGFEGLKNGYSSVLEIRNCFVSLSAHDQGFSEFLSSNFDHGLLKSNSPVAQNV